MTITLPSVASGGREGRTPVAFALLCVAATLAAPLAAQDRGLGPSVEYSEPVLSACAPVPRTTQPSPQERTQARELGSAARQSVVLGDLERARDLLLRAVRLDPTAPSVPYYLARVLDDQGEREQALAEYCRTLTLGAPREEAAFARERIEALTGHEDFQTADATVAEELRTRDDAVTDEPRIPDAAVTEELRSPDDAVAPSTSTGPRRSRAERDGASPTAALTLGMLIPGLGHYYSGRPVRGTVVASLAMGALASGFLVQKRSVDCLEPVGDGEGCLPGAIADVERSRPYLTTGIAVAGGVALLGALDAYFGAREERRARSFTEARGPHVEGPSISSRGGVTELSFLTIRMR